DLGEPRHADAPRARLLERLLELGAHERAVVEAAVARARGAALVAEAAQVVALVLADVAVTRDVEAIRTAAGVGHVEVALHRGARTPGLVVIHDVVAELARIVAEAVRETARGRVQ